MIMDEDTNVLRDYLIFTVPHVTVLAGAILGVMMILGFPINVALGLFAMAYGIMLTILGIIIRPHVSGSTLYRLMMVFFVGLVGMGMIILFYGG